MRRGGGRGRVGATRLPEQSLDIRLAETDAQIAACWTVMAQLRPHVARDTFVARVRGMQRDGYRLAFVADGGAVRAVAGFRLGDMLHRGRYLYIDDLVTEEHARSRGYGGALFEWCVALAKREGCEELHLDSGVQRLDAHRFYRTKGMQVTSHHFALDLRPPPG